MSAQQKRAELATAGADVRAAAGADVRPVVQAAAPPEIIEAVLVHAGETSQSARGGSLNGADTRGRELKSLPVKDRSGGNTRGKRGGRGKKRKAAQKQKRADKIKEKRESLRS